MRQLGLRGVSRAKGTTHHGAANNPAATATTYCLRASHDRLPGETWHFKRGVDSTPRQLTCNA